MTLADVSLIGKKILVGIIVTVIPFIIIVGGLWTTQHLLSRHSSEKISSQNTLKP
jgi:pilus assembly protein TadC